MPRTARNLFQGEKLFHVMVQGIKKEKIFLNEREKLEYVKLLKKYQTEYQIKLIAYCMMGNHAHILVQVKDIQKLTNYMHKINTSYAIYYNKSHERVGYVYRDRFKSEVIRDAGHLYNCIIYIHNNPVKAKICKLASQYKYSSYYELLEKENEDIILQIYTNELEYKKAHNKRIQLEDNFIEIEEEKDAEIRQFIDEYLCSKMTNKFELKVNNEVLIPIIKKLKEIYNLSNRQIEEYLDVSREKIRKLMEKSQ